MSEHKHDFRPWHCELKGITCNKCFLCGKREYFAGNQRVYFQDEVDEIIKELKEKLANK